MTTQRPSSRRRTVEGLPQQRAKQPGQCYAPGCERAGEQRVGALFLCAQHAERWPRTWGDLHPPPVDP
jgi:hypothetical protein